MSAASQSSGLPIGNWETCAYEGDEKQRIFYIQATEAETEDCVRATLQIGHWQFGRDRWEGLSDLLRSAQVRDEDWWYLHRLDPQPRRALAIGGTTAVLQMLSELADQDKAWVGTEAMADIHGSPATRRLVSFLQKHGGFESLAPPNEDEHDLLIRRPSLQ